MATKPVVVGADGSEESLLAAEWAAMEANRHGLPLRIVSAPAMVPRMHACQVSPATVADALRGVSARALEAAVTRAEEVAPGLEITTDLLSGPPALAVAGSGAGAAMLVVGARGAGGFAAMILGSVSRYAGHPRGMPGDRGPAGDHGRPSGSGRRHPRSAGRERDADVRIRGGSRAPRRPGGRPRLVLVPARAARSGRSGRDGRAVPSPSRSPTRPPAACRPPWTDGGRSTRTCGSGMTSSTATPPACWRTTQPAPTWL